MLTKRLLISALLAVGTIGAAATPVASTAATHFELSFGTPVHHEYAAAHRPGHVRESVVTERQAPLLLLEQRDGLDREEQLVGRPAQLGHPRPG